MPENLAKAKWMSKISHFHNYMNMLVQGAAGMPIKRYEAILSGSLTSN